MHRPPGRPKLGHLILRLKMNEPTARCDRDGMRHVKGVVFLPNHSFDEMF
jgi:hypothetical protein